MSHTLPGLLVVFEGIDGAGKSTQIRRLGLLCEALGLECVSSREPTYGQYG
ncbi:MAG: dTMP kinase, partial [Xanthomonadales bacterium]|nr:dTMP kinase [Xanthomonadales bacterium]